MPFKVSILFQCLTGGPTGGFGGSSHVGGWSESVYYNSSDINALRARLLTTGSWGFPLVTARAALLPASASIVGYRISTVYPRTGRSQVAKIRIPGSSGLITDVPQMALASSIPSISTPNVRRFGIRCVPDSQVVNGEYSPSGPYGPDVTSYFSSLGNWQFVGQDLTEPNWSVVGVSALGVVTLTAMPPWNVGDFVYVKNTIDPMGNKFTAGRTVSAIGPILGQVTLLNWGVGVSTGGLARRYSIGFFTMDGSRGAVDRVTVRKVGRPFDQYRGRRSRRATR